MGIRSQSARVVQSSLRSPLPYLSAKMPFFISIHFCLLWFHFPLSFALSLVWRFPVPAIWVLRLPSRAVPSCPRWLRFPARSAWVAPLALIASCVRLSRLPWSFRCLPFWWAVGCPVLRLLCALLLWFAGSLLLRACWWFSPRLPVPSGSSPRPRSVALVRVRGVRLPLPLAWAFPCFSLFPLRLAVPFPLPLPWLPAFGFSLSWLAVRGGCLFRSGLFLAACAARFWVVLAWFFSRWGLGFRFPFVVRFCPAFAFYSWFICFCSLPPTAESCKPLFFCFSIFGGVYCFFLACLVSVLFSCPLAFKTAFQAVLNACFFLWFFHPCARRWRSFGCEKYFLFVGVFLIADP